MTYTTRPQKPLSSNVLCHERAEAGKPVEHRACNTMEHKMAALLGSLSA